MFNRINFKDLIILILVAGLFILAFFVIKPVLFSIIYGILLAYIFYPIYFYLRKKVKNKTLAALIVTFGVLIVLVLGAWILINTLLKQSVSFYYTLREVDLTTMIKDLLPNFLTTSNFPIDISSSLNTMVSNFISNAFKKISDLILDVPKIVLSIFIVFFVFYYSMKDGQELIDFIKSLSPLKKETEDQFLKHFREVTNSVVLGHIVVGIVQGTAAGIGFYIFGVPNFLLLTVLSILFSVIPMVGPWIVWFPVDLYLFSIGKTPAAIGLLIYGLFFVSLIDNFLRLFIISKRTKINSAIVLVGMVGGIFTFGIIGLLIGPLVLAYILLIFDVYKKNKIGDDLVYNGK